MLSKSDFLKREYSKLLDLVLGEEETCFFALSWADDSLENLTELVLTSRIVSLEVYLGRIHREKEKRALTCSGPDGFFNIATDVCGASWGRRHV